MRYFPLFYDLNARRIVVLGSGEIAAAKLRLLTKTEAQIDVYCVGSPAKQLREWAQSGDINLYDRPLKKRDLRGAKLFYAASGDDALDRKWARFAEKKGLIVNVVDNPDQSHFITPAIVDRDPVVVAVGTEGAAPVLARMVKANAEEFLPQSTGILARIGKTFRPKARVIAEGRPRREFWSEYYNRVGPESLKHGGEAGVQSALESLLEKHQSDTQKTGSVSIIGVGPGDPDLLTLKAAKAIRAADVIIHDRLVSPEILEIARREGLFVNVGKTPNAKSWKQDDINALMVQHAMIGAKIVRLKSGDAGIYGRLDEEMDALDAASIPFEIVPGITSAIAAAAELKMSLTRRHRNSEMRFITGHDIDGFAESDWQYLAKPGAVAAIYMGVRAAAFIQNRLIHSGASPATPITVVENASRLNCKTLVTRIDRLTDDLDTHDIAGPAIIFIGLTAREAEMTTQTTALAPMSEGLFAKIEPELRKATI